MSHFGGSSTLYHTVNKGAIALGQNKNIFHYDHIMWPRIS